MRIARAPFGLVSGGVGAIRWRSGCTRAAASRQPWHRPQGGAPASRLGAGHPPTAPASRPPVQSNAWANASAVVIRPAPVGPTNAYACATRSVASARRSRATARGWSRIASSATQEVLDERADLRGDVLVARGHEQEDLDERLGPDAGALEQAAHGEPEARPVGLAGALDPVPLGAQPASEASHLGRLARPLDSLERDEHSAHIQILRVLQYATLARGPAPIVAARAPGAAPPCGARPGRAGSGARRGAPRSSRRRRRRSRHRHGSS